MEFANIITSVWRPLRNPVEAWPLALSDGSKVKDQDLVETDHVRRLYTGATMNLLYRPGYEWFYINRQSKDEIIIIKNFDSSPIVKARCKLPRRKYFCS
jgi:hypothetical protein